MSRIEAELASCWDALSMVLDFLYFVFLYPWKHKDTDFYCDKIGAYFRSSVEWIAFGSQVMFLNLKNFFINVIHCGSS